VTADSGTRVMTESTTIDIDTFTWLSRWQTVLVADVT